MGLGASGSEVSVVIFPFQSLYEFARIVLIYPERPDSIYWGPLLSHVPKAFSDLWELFFCFLSLSLSLSLSSPAQFPRACGTCDPRGSIHIYIYTWKTLRPFINAGAG